MHAARSVVEYVRPLDIGSMNETSDLCEFQFMENLQVSGKKERLSDTPCGYMSAKIGQRYRDVYLTARLYLIRSGGLICTS